MPIPSEPRYLLPQRTLLLDLALAMLLGHKRSFRAHARRMLEGLHVPLHILGAEHIPHSGPGVITVNHYARPGFWAPWFAAAISASVPVEIYWTMTGALTFTGQPFPSVKRWLSGQVLGRVARAYNFNSMPPMPPAPDEAAARAASVHRLIAYIRAHPDALVALAPEGGDQPGGVLALPPAGFGKLALLLARRGMPFYPVGIYEVDGCLTLCFGSPYHLLPSDISDRSQADWLARRQVMQAIAACLPQRLRGEF